MSEGNVSSVKNSENKSRRIVKISITGRELLENKIVQTTDENIAKKEGIFDSKAKYGPIAIIIGENEVFPKIESTLVEMKKGEIRKVKLSPAEAFGERDANLIRILPLVEFTKKKIIPFPGLVISADNLQGKVQSVSGGRVRVDFNHPFAGRELEYEVKLEEEITSPREIAEVFYEKYYSMIPGAKKEISENELKVTLKPEFIKNLEKVNKAIQKIADSFGLKITLVQEDSKNQN